MKNLILTFALFNVFIGFSQTKTVHVKYTNQPITVDAVLDEAVWAEAEAATNFWQHFPTDSLQAKQQAEIKMLFDDRNLYVGIKVNSANDEYIIPSLRRDFRASGNDNISLLFDTFNDGTNAFAEIPDSAVQYGYFKMFGSDSSVAVALLPGTN